MRLTALSRAAIALGLTPNLTLADARARVPELVALDRDHSAEARLLSRIVADCVRYTPMAAAEPPDGAILDITGCAHAFGGEEYLRSDLVRHLSGAGITAFCALGDTPEQARALVRDLVLALQAVLLVKNAPPEVADAFCASRLEAGAGATFGLLPRGTDARAIVARASG